MKLTRNEKSELLLLISREWEKHPDWSFAGLIREISHLANGNNLMGMAEDSRLLKAFRRGYSKCDSK